MSKEGPSEDKAKLSHSTAHTPESISSLEATVMLPKNHTCSAGVFLKVTGAGPWHESDCPWNS